MSDSLFDLRASDLSAYLSIYLMSKDPRIFRTFCKPCNRNICWIFWKLLSVVKSNFDRYNQQTNLLLYMCQISDPLFDVWFPTFHFYQSKCDITRPPNFRKFLLTTEECCNRNIYRTFCKWGSLVESNLDRYDRWIILLLYICQISDSLFDVWFPTCHFYPSKCGITRSPNFRKFLQTAKKCCNKNFAANWEISSNWILTSRPSGSFINVKLVIHYLMYGFQPFSSTC